MGSPCLLKAWRSSGKSTLSPVQGTQKPRTAAQPTHGGMPKQKEDMSISWYFPNYRICLAILSYVPCDIIETHKFSSFCSLVGTAFDYLCGLGLVANAFQTPNRDKIGGKRASIPFSLGLQQWQNPAPMVPPMHFP